MTEPDRSCPQCQSRDLDSELLSVKASGWPVMFGSQPVMFGRQLFQKHWLIAYACKECGYVFLYRGSKEEEFR